MNSVGINQSSVDVRVDSGAWMKMTWCVYGPCPKEFRKTQERLEVSRNSGEMEPKHQDGKAKNNARFAP